MVGGRYLLIASLPLLMLTATCSSSDETRQDSSVASPVDPTARPAPVRLLALGDSYTIGEQVGKLEDWPIQLARALRVSGRGAAEPRIVAATGWDTAQLSRAIGFASGLAALTESAVSFADGNPDHVILISIPDWSVTPFAEGAPREQIANSIDEFNDAIRAQAATSGVRFIDITEISRRVPDEPELIAGDGLHPSGAMYAEWVELLLPVLVEVIG